MTVTVHNFWYDENASDGGAHIPLPDVDPPIDPPTDRNAVPEPATFGLGMLAMGAAGVAAFKRRREAEAAA